jgi:hypothetical protein
MEAASTSETTVNIYQTKRPNILPPWANQISRSSHNSPFYLFAPMWVSSAVSSPEVFVLKRWIHFSYSHACYMPHPSHSLGKVRLLHFLRTSKFTPWSTLAFFCITEHDTICQAASLAAVPLSERLKGSGGQNTSTAATPCWTPLSTPIKEPFRCVDNAELGGGASVNARIIIAVMKMSDCGANITFLIVYNLSRAALRSHSRRQVWTCCCCIMVQQQFASQARDS